MSANFSNLSDVKKEPLAFLRHLYDVAVQRALPSQVLQAYLPVPPKGRTLVLGAGKAAGAMVHALEKYWPENAPLSGLVVTRYHHTPPAPSGHLGRIEIVEAAHPVPDQAGVDAATRMMALTQGLSADDLVICLISGGGSALLSWPAQGLTLQDKQNINRGLLESGASIAEMNCVRKHLSRIKGGRLAQACGVAKVVTLTISDVPGDDPAIIASGPTVADQTTCEQALEILVRYRIDIPEAVKDDLIAGRLETPKPSAPWQNHEIHMIATPAQSLQAAAQAAQAVGLNAYVLSDAIEGESRDIGAMHAALARWCAQGQGPFQAPCVLLSGGETTVTVKPAVPGESKGRGGRAGEFGMGLAKALASQSGVWALAADTDGIDGVEDNAGVVVHPETLPRALEVGMKIDQYLARNDAYGFFSTLDDLVITGPTHTNVNDFRAILVLR